MTKLQATDLSKRFGSRRVFSKVSFEVTPGNVLAVVGPNGSGKSTMLLTLLGEYRPNKGEVVYSGPDGPFSETEIRARSSLVSPYMNVYDSLTAEENIVFFAQLTGHHFTGKELSAMLDRVGLSGRGAEPVGAYSSGMKQRLKYALAASNDPLFFFLDEPTSNLDDTGKAIVAEFVEEFRHKAALVIATNEQEDRRFADQFCQLDG